MATRKMDDKDVEALAAAGAKYNAATTDEERAAAHKEAEDIRAKYNYSGGDDGSQHIELPTSGNKAAGGQYVGVGKGDDYYQQQVGMENADREDMDYWGNVYNNATTEAEKNYAHKQAQAIREKYGYSGGGDGSEYIKLPGQDVIGSFSYDKAPTYNDRYTERIDAMLDKLLNRDTFSYDHTQDPLFAQYQQQYLREGERAMQDTLGEMSARTGGLASSWAQTAAQQQQNYYASQVADKIPELYQLAYQMYLNDIDQQVTDLGLMQNMSDSQYNRYRDTMSDWQNDRNFAYGVYRDDIADNRYQNEWDYNVGRDQLEDERYDQEWAYQLAQDAVKGSSGTTKPNLTAAQTLKALEDGIVNDTTLSAYRYYFGEDWDSGGEEENADSEAWNAGLSDGYKAVLSELSATEDRGFPDSVKAQKFVDIIQKAYESGRLTDREANELLSQYGLL